MSVICDFCSSEDVRWSYPARDFVARVVPIAGSEGGWAACDACHDLIEADDLDGLAKRSAETFVEKNGAIFDQPELVAMLRQLHQQFVESRTGEAVAA